MSWIWCGAPRRCLFCFSGDPVETGNIASLWNLDAQGIALTFPLIIIIQAPPQAARFYSHNGRGLSIIRVIAVKHVMGDGETLNTIFPALKGFVDNVAQEFLQARGVGEFITAQNTLELVFHSVGINAWHRLLS